MRCGFSAISDVIFFSSNLFRWQFRIARYLSCRQSGTVCVQSSAHFDTTASFEGCAQMILGGIGRTSKLARNCEGDFFRIFFFRCCSREPPSSSGLTTFLFVCICMFCAVQINCISLISFIKFMRLCAHFQSAHLPLVRLLITSSQLRWVLGNNNRLCKRIAFRPRDVLRVNWSRHSFGNCGFIFNEAQAPFPFLLPRKS